MNLAEMCWTMIWYTENIHLGTDFTELTFKGLFFMNKTEIRIMMDHGRDQKDLENVL